MIFFFLHKENQVKEKLSGRGLLFRAVDAGKVKILRQHKGRVLAAAARR